MILKKLKFDFMFEMSNFG